MTLQPDPIAEPPQAIKAALASRAKDVSMLPSLATEALQLAKDVDCTPAQLAAIIERDVSMATEILTIANSAAFSSGRPILSLREAVVRLGFRQCNNLIITSSATSLMKNLPLDQEWVRELLWTHSYATASTCVHLNRVLGLGFQGEEFTAGLLHDFGRFLLAVATPELFMQADPINFQDDDDQLDRERDLIGIDHCELGAWYAANSGLPEALSAAIRFHHDIQVDHPDGTLIALVAAADDIANHLQIYEEAEGYDPEGNQGIARLAEIRSSNLIQKFSGICDTLMTEVLKDVSETFNLGAGVSS